jgi:hypothetical protein
MAVRLLLITASVLTRFQMIMAAPYASNTARSAMGNTKSLGQDLKQLSKSGLLGDEPRNIII